MPGLFGLLLAMEAGVPVPVPGDVVMLLVGERVSLPPGRALLALVAVLVGAAAWLLRRRAARGEATGRSLLEGCCPACLTAGALAAARLRTRAQVAPP